MRRVAFNILALRTSEDTDATIWPVPARQPGGLLTEPENHDGSRVFSFPVTSVYVGEETGGGMRKLFSGSKITGWVTITDSRVIFAASKWDTGRIYWGVGIGAAVALTATGVSKARAAARSRGKILAGQVRYPTLRSAGASIRTGRQGTDQIRLGYSWKPEGATAVETYVLDLTFPAGTANPVAAAEDIIHRCAAYKLAHYPDADEDKKARLTKLLTAQIEPPQPGRIKWLNMPSCYSVGSKAAIPPDLNVFT